VTGTEINRPGSRGRDQVGPVDAALAGLDARDAAEALTRGVNDILNVTPRMPTRLHLRFGRASVELEWPEVGEMPELARVGLGAPQFAEERLEILAPLVGVYYMAPEPGAMPFVSVGDEVEPGQQVAIIEAMKLMNPILAEDHATVAEILVADAESVEYGQPLMVLEPRACP